MPTQEHKSKNTPQENPAGPEKARELIQGPKIGSIEPEADDIDKRKAKLPLAEAVAQAQAYVARLSKYSQKAGHLTSGDLADITREFGRSGKPSTSALENEIGIPPNDPAPIISREEHSAAEITRYESTITKYFPNARFLEKKEMGTGKDFVVVIGAADAKTITAVVEMDEKRATAEAYLRQHEPAAAVNGEPTKQVDIDQLVKATSGYPKGHTSGELSDPFAARAPVGPTGRQTISHKRDI